MICYTKESFNLSETIRDFKRFSANAIINKLLSESSNNKSDETIKIFQSYGAANRNNLKYQLWYQHNKPMELYSPKWVYQKIAYIHNNPVRAGIVENPEEYSLSSAKQYMGENGIIDVEILDFGSVEGYISGY